MKTRFLYLATILLTLTFAFVVYSSTGSAKTFVYASGDSCCAMKDCCQDGKCQMDCCRDGKCEMHKKNGEATTKKGDCCQGKDSCPMKKGEKKINQ